MSLRILIFALIGWLCFHSTLAQVGNPFNLKQNSVQDSSQVFNTPQDSLAEWKNPFKMRKSIHQRDGEISLENPITSWITTKNKYKINESDIKTLLFWGQLFLTFLLAIALNINRSVTLKMYRSIININFLSLLYRESKEDISLVFYLLYGLYFIGFSLFLYLLITHYQGIKAPVYIVYLAGCIIIVYSLKHLTLKWIGWVYGLSKETDRYLFSIVVFSCMIAILLIPANFVISFVSPVIGKKCLFVVGVMLIILLIYRQLREIAFSINLWQGRILHFLLYLCTFEIAPVICLYVYLSRNGVI